MQTLRNRSNNDICDNDREKILESMIGTEEEFKEFERSIAESLSDSIKREKKNRSLEEFKQTSDVTIPPELTIGREEFEQACDGITDACAEIERVCDELEREASANDLIKGVAVRHQIAESLLDLIKRRNVNQSDIGSDAEEDVGTEDHNDNKDSEDNTEYIYDDSDDESSNRSDDEADTDLCLNCKAIFWSMFYDIVFFFIQYKKEIVVYAASVLLLTIFVGICLFCHWRVVDTIFGTEN
jgi:hypothetical protein